MVRESILRVNAVIEKISRWAGEGAKFILPLVGLILVFEVCARYVFGKPTVWAHEASQHLFGVAFILGGAYAYIYGSHVNVDLIVRRFSPRVQAGIYAVTFLLFALYFIVMLRFSIPIAIDSWERHEVTMSVWGPPYYPLKTAVPVGALLILLQGTAKFLRDLYFVISGREVTSR